MADIIFNSDSKLLEFSEALKGIKGEPSSIAISHSGNTANFVQALEQCKSLSDMTTLEIFSTALPQIQQINGAMATLIEVLQSNPQLEEIHLGNVGLTDNNQTMELFAAMQNHPHLKTIKLSGTVFGDEPTQNSFFAAMTEKRNLRSLDCAFEFYPDHTGLRQLLRTSTSLESLLSIPVSDFSELAADLRLNPDSYSSSNISHLSVVRKENDAIDSVIGTDLDSAIQFLLTKQLQDRNKPFVSLLFESVSVFFKDEATLNKLLGTLQATTRMHADFHITAIGEKYNIAGADRADRNYVQQFSRRIHSIYSRNLGVQKAELEENLHSSEPNRTLTELVYLHHQNKYQQDFKEKPKEALAVSLKARTFFSQKDVPGVAESLPELKSIDDKIKDDKNKYNL